MPCIKLPSARIKAISTCVPAKRFDNMQETTAFPKEDVQKVVRMAGVRERYLASDAECSSDLCETAARDVIEKLNWDPESIDALIMVTQSPDYFLPSTACLIHDRLNMSPDCAAFDLGLGCSGYPYGLWISTMMLQSRGLKRVLLLHGETPTRFCDWSDRSVALLFGDAGSATAIEQSQNSASSDWVFNLHTDGKGYRDLIIDGGGFRNRFPENERDYYVRMNGANIFNFAVKRVPPLIEATLSAAHQTLDDIDFVILHQSNQFIMRHLAKKIGIPAEKAPFTIGKFGSAGGPSVPLTITKGALERPEDRSLRLLLVGYGVGLSWGSALIDLPPDAFLNHIRMKG